MKLRCFHVITVSQNINNKFNTQLIKDATESDAKNYIRIAIKNGGFGVMISRTFPSAYPEYFKVTKNLINKYIKAMESGSLIKIMKMYEALDKIGMKVSINY